MSSEAETPLHPDIKSLLRRLRSHIQRYILLEGTASVLVVLGSLFWLSLGADWAYFRASKLELPLWFRAMFDVAVACVLAFVLVTWIGLRLLTRFRAKALALVLERRFPELDDRLITAVELAASAPAETPLTHAMWERTVDDVVRRTQNLELADVFEKRPLRCAVVLAAVLVASIAGFAFANREAVERWKLGYWDLEDHYWQREYGLTVKVIAQPGDMVKQFVGNEYKHPRGADLTLVMEVADGKKVPEAVELRYRLDNGRGSGRIPCTRVDERTFRHSAAGLLDSLDFYVMAGDFTNRDAYRVIVVDPPRVDRVVLHCNYPEYTGLNVTDDSTGEQTRDAVTVLGPQVSLPMETEFLMEVRSNKPLVGARIQFDPFELEIVGGSETVGGAAAASPASASLIVKSEDGAAFRTDQIPSRLAARFIAADGKSLTVPFVVTNVESKAARERVVNLSTPFGPSLMMRPDTAVRVFLEDADQIVSLEPARLAIYGTVDQPPVVETRLRGIGSSITRKARVPFTGLISDDYGLGEARFEFTIDGQEDWKTRPLQNPPANWPKDFRLRLTDADESERFDALPLGLAIGQKLSVAVAAQDGDNLNGPHTSRGERYQFQIVSNEELLSLLYQKELNLRRRFEQILSELKETQANLIRHLARAEDRRTLEKAGPAAGKESEHADTLRTSDTSLKTCAERALHTIRKDANETAAIEESFRDLREELVNNQVHTPQMLERIDDRIVTPLHDANVRDYPDVDAALGLFKLANDRGDDPAPAINRSIDALTALIERLERVLLEMRKLETFQEALEILKSIIQDEEKLIDRTETERKRFAIEKLKGLGLEKD